MEDEAEEFQERISINLDLMSPFNPKKMEKRFELNSQPMMKSMMPTRNVMRRNVTDSIKSFDLRFEKNLNQVVELQKQLKDLEMAKSELVKDFMILTQDKEFLEKDNVLLRKEKDFLDKMYKICQEDLLRLKESYSDTIKMKESKYQSTINDLQQKLTERMNQQGESRNMDNFNNANFFKESFMSKSQTVVSGNFNELHRKKLELLEKNLSRVMQEKKHLQGATNELRKEMDEKNRKIQELEVQLEPLAHFNKPRNYYESWSDNVHCNNKNIFSVADVSAVEMVRYDKEAQVDDLLPAISHQACEAKYNDCLRKYLQSENSSKLLTDKLEHMVRREISLQNNIDDLEFKLRVYKKLVQQDL